MSKRAPLRQGESWGFWHAQWLRKGLLVTTDEGRVRWLCIKAHQYSWPRGPHGERAKDYWRRVETCAEKKLLDGLARDVERLRKGPLKLDVKWVGPVKEIGDGG